MSNLSMSNASTSHPSPSLTASSNLCLHIGCGLVVADNWYNIDASPSLRLNQMPLLGAIVSKMFNVPNWSNNVQYGNIVKGLKLAPNSCDLIYASHVLEHLALADFHTAMDHIYTYIKPGGIFRAVVPDLSHLINIYLQESQTPQTSPHAAGHLMRDSLLGYGNSRSGLFYRLKEAFANSRHQWMWDKPAIKQAFLDHHFKQVRFCDYGDWKDERFATVEHPETFINAIGIEGVK